MSAYTDELAGNRSPTRDYNAGYGIGHAEGYTDGIIDGKAIAYRQQFPRVLLSVAIAFIAGIALTWWVIKGLPL